MESNGTTPTTTTNHDTILAGAMRLRQRLIDLAADAADLFKPLAPESNEAILQSLHPDDDEPADTGSIGALVLAASNALDDGIQALVEVAEALACQTEPAVAGAAA